MEADVGTREMASEGWRGVTWTSGYQERKQEWTARHRHSWKCKGKRRETHRMGRVAQRNAIVSWRCNKSMTNRNDT